MAHSEYDHIAWLDLETVGGNERTDQILELGLVLTDRHGNVVADYQSPVHLSDDGRGILYNGSEVSNKILEMHTNSGLLEDAEKTAMTLEDLDEEVVEWLKSYGVEKKRAILAGSGVGHFDQRFLRVQLPALATFLHYANLDVGQNRRSYRAYEAPEFVAPVLASYADGEKKHRALADAYAHLEEFNAYKMLNKVLKALVAEKLGADFTQEQLWDFVMAEQPNLG